MHLRLIVVAVASVLVLAASGCGEDDEPVVTPRDESTTTAAPADVVFPAARAELEHGGSTWAVVLAGSATGEGPEIDAAIAAAATAGYTTGVTDCDDGAPEALGLDESAYTVSVYFESEDDAQAALEAVHATGFDGGAAAQVQTFCLD